MEIPIPELDAAILNSAFLECQLNSERTESLRLQLEEEKRKKPTLEIKLQSLINDLYRKLELEKAAPIIDLARKVVICKNVVEEDSE